MLTERAAVLIMWLGTCLKPYLSIKLCLSAGCLELMIVDMKGQCSFEVNRSRHSIRGKRD